MPAPETSSKIPTYFQTMSAAPASPAPSKLPEANLPLRLADESSSDPQPDPSPSSLPEPLIRLELRNLRHASTGVFLNHLNLDRDVADLNQTVLQLLYLPTGTASSSTSSPQSTRPHPYKPHIPGTRSVTLIAREIDGVAYTTGLELDDQHKEIHISLSYIQHVAKSSKDSSAITKELRGVICHELVHCWQHNARGTAPGGLIEGIADWVRLRAGFIPPHWKREGGDKWDAGYQTTGYFLDWLEHEHGEGSVRRLNEALRDVEYDEDKFWKQLYGETVHHLWSKYCKSLEK